MFEHAALFYADDRQFLEGTGAFIREGLRAGEDVMVAVNREKTDWLDRSLGTHPDRVTFLDMGEVGMNPARIIPAWRQFVDEHQAQGHTVRGIGEPIWPERSPAELVECEHHEALLNVAFEGTDPWRLLCPYDTARLDPAVVDHARVTHPWIRTDGLLETSERFGCASVGVLDDPLPVPPPDRAELSFGREDDLAHLRGFVAEQSDTWELPSHLGDDLMLAVSELAANSLEHGGGQGILEMWAEGRSIVSQVSDGGHITDPLVGRRVPTVRQVGGRGLWVANQVCDLVQIRSSEHGTTVRVQLASSPQT